MKYVKAPVFVKVNTNMVRRVFLYTDLRFYIKQCNKKSTHRMASAMSATRFLEGQVLEPARESRDD